jgi:tetratricopeptide (TPR) repeat protein
MEGKTLMKHIVFKSAAAGVVFALGVTLAGCGDGTPEQAMARAVAFAGQGRWDKASQIAERTARRYPDMVASQILRAVTAERCGDRNTALDAARRAVELDPESFEARYTLGRLYAADTARASEAEQVLIKAWKMRRDDVRVKILLCNVAMAMNSPRAIGYLSMISRLPELKDSAELKNQFAVSYVRKGDITSAQRYFAAAFRAGRSNPEIILNVARFYDGCLRNGKVAARLYGEYLRTAGIDDSGKVEAAARLSHLEGAK